MASAAEQLHRFEKRQLALRTALPLLIGLGLLIAEWWDPDTTLVLRGRGPLMIPLLIPAWILTLTGLWHGRALFLLIRRGPPGRTLTAESAPQADEPDATSESAPQRVGRIGPRRRRR